MSKTLLVKIARHCEKLAVRFEKPTADGIAVDESGRLYRVDQVDYRIVACPICGKLGDAFDFRGVMLAGCNRWDGFFHSQHTCPTRACGGSSSNYRRVPVPGRLVYTHYRRDRA